MSGLSFIHAGFVVAGVAAASLPILIHLLMKQRSRVMPIGSVRFLQSVLRQHTRRRRIRQWLLLALRTLAVLLLGLLFARPFLSQFEQNALERQVIVLLDRSASMQARGEDGRTLFEAGRKLVGDELSGVDEQTAVQLGLFDAAGVEGVSLEQLMESAAPSDAATDYGQALAWARDLMVSSSRNEHRVVLVTDLQRSGMDRTWIDDFPVSAELVIHDVGRPLSQNVAVEDCAARRTEIRPGEPVRIDVRLVNGGAVPARDIPVKLELQGPRGRIQVQQNVSLAGGATETIPFELEQITADGIYEGRVHFERDDDLAADNQRFLAFEARYPDRLLLVDGQQGRSVYTNETYYLETALRLRMPLSAGPTRSFEIERIVWEDGDGFPALEGFRAIVLCNVGRLDARDGGRLRDYVRQGGNLLVFAGDQTSPVVIERLEESGLLNVRVARDPARGKFRGRNWDRQHPVFAPFADPQQGDLRTLSFDQMLEATEVREPARVLMEAGPFPLMIEQPLGEGTTILVTTAADRQWSDWPRSRLYVPLVRQMLAYLSDQLGDRAAVRSRLVEAGDERAGITADGQRRLVLNLDPRESRLDRLSVEEFRESLGMGEVPLEQRTAGIRLPETRSRSSEFWTWLMWILLFILAVETLLASRVHA